MKVDLRFEKNKNGKIVIHDVSEYSVDDLKTLYRSVNLAFKVKKEQEKNLFEQEKQLKEELHIIRNRLNQLKKFMESEGIEIPKEEKKE